MNVLAGYASAHGSTAEVAAFIAQELEKREFEVTVANVADVESVDGYDAFVLGSAVHDGMWLTEMSQFLERFQDTLKDAPVMYYMTCVRVLEDDGEAHARQEYVNHRVMDALGIVEIGVFAGRLEQGEVDWDERWTLAARYDGNKLPGTLDQDFRDWGKIRAWRKRPPTRYCCRGDMAATTMSVIVQTAES